MRNRRAAANTIDEYIAGYPPDVRERLQKIRRAIRKAAPDAGEAISYGMPTFKLSGNLVHFAAFKEHIGFFPTPSGVEKFERELAAYETSKGTIRFPHDKPIPLGLIGRIVKFRVRESLARAAAGGKMKAQAGEQERRP